MLPLWLQFLITVLHRPGQRQRVRPRLRNAGVGHTVPTCVGSGPDSVTDAAPPAEGKGA